LQNVSTDAGEEIRALNDGSKNNDYMLKMGRPGGGAGRHVRGRRHLKLKIDGAQERKKKEIDNY